MHTQDQKHLTHFLLHCSTWKWALLYPDCNMVTHLLCTWCLSSAYYMQDPEFPPRGKTVQGVYGFATPMGGGAGLSGWVCWLYLCWPVVGVWGGSSMGETQESCSTTVARIFKMTLMSVCLTNTEPTIILGPLRRLLLGFATSDVRHSPFPLGPSKADKIACRWDTHGKCTMDSQQIRVIKKDDRFHVIRDPPKCHILWQFLPQAGLFPHTS